MLGGWSGRRRCRPTSLSRRCPGRAPPRLRCRRSPPHGPFRPGRTGRRRRPPASAAPASSGTAGRSGCREDRRRTAHESACAHTWRWDRPGGVNALRRHGHPGQGPLPRPDPPGARHPRGRPRRALARNAPPRVFPGTALRCLPAARFRPVVEPGRIGRRGGRRLTVGAPPPRRTSPRASPPGALPPPAGRGPPPGCAPPGPTAAPGRPPAAPWARSAPAPAGSCRPR